ncbi:disks large-associated protein 5-like isoform X2 [Pecten maximus]|uniref:disks large-associated protein 5-like isoform X2 n=1 Tax=Pecten maximus TaxID=6579 RepID=UPI0014589F5C|nr:disks large-associated protein 5-like isoform X2 [Pecten maximus]
MDMRDAYKIKSSTIDAKKLRLNRRSIDWKNNRQEEANKGRNIQNLSPLQELSPNVKSKLTYEGKTPTKGNTAKDGGRKRNIRNQDDMKREFTKWKKEKELKKKLEKQKQLQKPSFKVFHVAHSDTNLYKNSKKGNQICSVAGYVSTLTKMKPSKPVAVESIASTKKKAGNTMTKKSETPNPTPKVVAPAPISGRVTRSQNASKETKSARIQSNTNRPSTRSTKTTQKQKASGSSKPSLPKKSANEKKVTGRDKPQNLNLEKVSTFRGLSFAPDDFTFSAPSNISTFEFKPLSPASTARFLYPATTSFIGTDPKRCSTPKSHSSEDSKLYTEDCSVNLADVSNTNIPSLSADGEMCDDTVTLTKIAERKTIATADFSHLSETRRVTRSLRQSILETQSATPTTEVHGQTSNVNSTKTSEENIIKTSFNSSVQEETKHIDGVMSSAPREPTMVKESSTPLDSQKEGKSIPKRITRSLRRSLCLSPPSEALDSPKKVFTPRNKSEQASRPVIATEEVVNTKPLEDEVFSDSPTREGIVKGNVNQTPDRRNTRRTMSNFATFVPPSSDCLVMSASRSKRKRRKTQHDRPVNPKSPEEWVNLLKSSPMVEMNRRTPKTKTFEPLLALDLDMDFDEETIQKTGDTSAVTSEAADAASTPLGSADMSSATSTSTDMNKDESEPSPTKSHSESASCEGLPSSQTQEISSKPEEHNVQYFRQLMSTESSVFNGYCSKWEEIMKSTQDLNEEVEGQIRTCIGQAQLLMSQRFKQFTGLVDNCEFGSGEKETTLSDLQGFWDMIYYQVEDVHTKFADLDKLKANNWVDDKPKVQKKILKKKTAVKPAVKRPAVASKFAAFRAQMKKKQTVPDILCHEEPAVTFDGGFFKVSSPERTRKFHCEAGSPQRKVSTSSAEKEKAQESKKTPLLEVVSSGVDSLGLTSLRTPSRKSYVPVNPSPLLRDITPQVTSKGQPARHSLSKRLRSGVDAEPALNNKENDMDDVFSSDNSVKSTETPLEKSTTVTPKSKITPRRSLRSRRSLCDVSSPSTVQETDNNDFFKYLQPSSADLSKAPCSTSVLDNDGDCWDLSTAFSDTETTDRVKGSPSIPKQRTSSLKQLPSSQRRRSTRRSVHFSTSTTIEHTLEDIKDVPGRVGDDMLIFTPPGQKSLMSLEDDISSSITQNAGATPACRNSRPSLLFTPPQDTSPLTTTNTTMCTEIPTDILISFTP